MQLNNQIDILGNMQIVLLSGGSGKRLWTLSNNARSKQFLPLLDKEDGSMESMVQRVVRQVREAELTDNITLATKENTKPTVHPKIMVAQVREYLYELAIQNEIELYQLSETFDDMAIVKKMKEIVPEFKSQNSRYQNLD